MLGSARRAELLGDQRRADFVSVDGELDGLEGRFRAVALLASGACRTTNRCLALLARGLVMIVVALSGGCVSIAPRPPQAPGVSWTREVLAQGSAPRTRTTTRATLSGTNNLRVPHLLAGADFRYRLDLTIDQPGARHELRCGQREGGVYRCEGNGALASLELRDDCREGLAATANGAALTVAPWLDRGVHVGFLVSEDGRPIAAIDTDHQWVRPLWTDRELSPSSRVATDTVAYILDDMLRAEEDGGRPFLCGSLASTRRYPR